ncbi:hypothetical protein I3843_02G098800 [Carya illinoinensis]|uniref:Uncharacterized protein n=1 Tax=Carya illinoinensis TaxID=32201 RepID=A0A922K0B4_CARIL|nr:uncharacterized protein LOC122300699 isoform X4 [Carya illinoinensis]KAG2722102.1 hypothetical protein I3760_02G114600 [Carya illinoinensis]KAG6727056.1 hypothetical protein I3842_02G112500 [Carya illinoinensis]KAG7991838.1 hypothetical protein I3843_02G098800 [Carya illinoinensis]
MGFVSFLGRVLFASLFILAAWKMYNEFGTDGGPAAKELAMKFAVLQKNLSSKLGVRVPDVDLLNLVLTTPILCDFYNYTPDEPNHHILLYEFLQSMALCGALLFFLGMKNSILKRQRKKKATKTKTV